MAPKKKALQDPERAARAEKLLQEQELLERSNVPGAECWSVGESSTLGCNSDGSRSVPQDVEPSFLASQLAGALKVTTETVNKYARKAGVQTPKRGQRNYRYSVQDAVKIASKMVEASEGVLRNQATIVLKSLKGS
jgi:hypothetical protein